jgi:hypothetical protein
MTSSQNDRGEFLRTEYTVLSQYFGTVITFRFTTASFFLAAVALVLQIEDLEWHHYLLLLMLSLGIWIVELLEPLKVRYQKSRVPSSAWLWHC